MRPLALLVLVAFNQVKAADPHVLKAAVQKLRNGQAKVDDIGPDCALRRILKANDPSRGPWEFQLLASEWHLRAHMLAVGSQFPLPAPGSPDLTAAWDLVGAAQQKSQSLHMKPTGALYRGGDAKKREEAAHQVADSINTQEVQADAARAMVWIALEAAVRLQDRAKADLALPQALRAKELNPRELGLAFMAAGYAGKWEAMSTLGETLSANPGIMAQVRALSTQSPTMPDFPSVLKLVQEDLPDTLEGQVGHWKIHQLTYRFREAKCADPSFAVGARQAFAQVATGPLEAGVSRFGAVVHWVKPGGQALPLSGPAAKGRLRLQGQHQKTVDGIQLGVIETLDLSQDPANPRHWTGTQRTEQRVLEGQAPAAKTYTLLLDVDADLEAMPR